jgi:hypothetical protein
VSDAGVIDPGMPEPAVPPATGQPRVDAALRGLADAAHAPVAEQIAAYESMHTALRETLGEIERV